MDRDRCRRRFRSGNLHTRETSVGGNDWRIYLYIVCDRFKKAKATGFRPKLSHLDRSLPEPSGIDKAAASSREITRSFGSYTVDRGLTGAVGAELKFGCADGSPRTELRSQPSSSSCSRFATVYIGPSDFGCGHRGFGWQFQWTYIQIFPNLFFCVRF